jgi:hypothetical protein
MGLLTPRLSDRSYGRGGRNRPHCTAESESPVKMPMIRLRRRRRFGPAPKPSPLARPFRHQRLQVSVCRGARGCCAAVVRALDGRCGCGSRSTGCNSNKPALPQTHFFFLQHSGWRVCQRCQRRSACCGIEEQSLKTYSSIMPIRAKPYRVRVGRRKAPVLQGSSGQAV